MVVFSKSYWKPQGEKDSSSLKEKEME